MLTEQNSEAPLGLFCIASNFFMPISRCGQMICRIGILFFPSLWPKKCPRPTPHHRNCPPHAKSAKPTTLVKEHDPTRFRTLDKKGPASRIGAEYGTLSQNGYGDLSTLMSKAFLPSPRAQRKKKLQALTPRACNCTRDYTKATHLRPLA